MNTAFFIARRYFFSKKKKGFIHVISWISMGAVMVGTAALVIILSVFNGLEGLIRSLFNAFDPELKIVAAQGKTFELTDSLMERVSAVPGLAVVTEVIEDNAYVRYRDSEMVVTMKGVSENFLDQHRLDNMVVHGDLKLREQGINYAIIGRGIQYALGVAPNNEFFALQVFYPKRGRSTTLAADPGRLINRRNIMPGAIFAIEKQYDERYIFVPLAFAQELTEYGNRRSSLEIKTENGQDPAKVKNALEETLGPSFKVLSSDEQHSSLLKAVKIEKFFVYIAGSFVLAVASFNIFFSLTMLALDKKQDIASLYAMGATNRLIRRIFLAEGAFISLTGAGIGLLVGFLVCWVQQQFGIISMGMETSILEAYPVKMQLMDFVLTGLSLIIITYLASFRPAAVATRVNINTKLA